MLNLNEGDSVILPDGRLGKVESAEEERPGYFWRVRGDLFREHALIDINCDLTIYTTTSEGFKALQWHAERQFYDIKDLSDEELSSSAAFTIHRDERDIILESLDQKARNAERMTFEHEPLQAYMYLDFHAPG